MWAPQSQASDESWRRGLESLGLARRRDAQARHIHLLRAHQLPPPSTQASDESWRRGLKTLGMAGGRDAQTRDNHLLRAPRLGSRQSCVTRSAAPSTRFATKHHEWRRLEDSSPSKNYNSPPWDSYPQIQTTPRSSLPLPPDFSRTLHQSLPQSCAHVSREGPPPFYEKHAKTSAFDPPPPYDGHVPTASGTAPPRTDCPCRHSILWQCTKDRGITCVNGYWEIAENMVSVSCDD
ncbi:hypothetical protein B0H14DRAFT_3470844 [Mycena olivaceomarginata]|nr:hypothetical protein B0H14DRAFT_3470844 [Mycena olivaceomarginata]